MITEGQKSWLLDKEGGKEADRPLATASILSCIKILGQFQKENPRDLEKEEITAGAFNFRLRSLMGSVRNDGYEIRVKEIKGSGIRAVGENLELEDWAEIIHYEGSDLATENYFWGFLREDNLKFVTRNGNYENLPMLGNQWYIKIGDKKPFVVPIEGIKKVELITVKESAKID